MKVLASLVKVFQEIKICMKEYWGNQMIEKLFSEYFSDDIFPIRARTISDSKLFMAFNGIEISL